MVDMTLPRGYGETSLYTGVILTAMWSGHSRTVYAAAVGSTLLAIVGFYLSPGSEVVASGIGRIVQLSAVWVTAILGGEYLRRSQLVTTNRMLEHRAQTLRSANEELETFAYSVSHDLRAPLRAMDGFSQALIDEYSERLDATALDYLSRIRKASQRMGLLIDDLLRLSRVGRRELVRREIDLTDMTSEIVAALQRASPGRRVEVVVEPDVKISGDLELMRIVMTNLLGNAWKYSGKTAEPRIEFGTRQGSGSEREYFVRDNGVGFDMKYADKLFIPFNRLHTDAEFEGTGIGLATVARVIRLHGGTVAAEGSVGNGATIRFTLG